MSVRGGQATWTATWTATRERDAHCYTSCGLPPCQGLPACLLLLCPSPPLHPTPPPPCAHCASAEYERQKAEDPEFYRTADSLVYGGSQKPGEEAVERMVKELVDRWVGGFCGEGQGLRWEGLVFMQYFGRLRVCLLRRQLVVLAARVARGRCPAALLLRL